MGFDAFLSGAVETADTIATLQPVSATPANMAATDLRLRLAVRGWVNPRTLLDSSMDKDEITDTLNVVADEVDSAFDQKPGSWYLSVAARRRVIALRGNEALGKELSVIRTPDDTSDSMRSALRFALMLDTLPALEKIPTEILQSLAIALDWFDRAPLQADRTTLPADIAAELAARVQQRDLARQTALPMVGRSHGIALEDLSRWLAEPQGKGLVCQYLYGSGGAGKSTLLAFLERDLSKQPNAPFLARIDFDDPLINPAEPISLDIALIGQLQRRYPRAVPRADEQVGMLRRLQRSQRQEIFVASGLRRRRIVREANIEALALESAHSVVISERISILYDVLRLPRPLVIIFDTVELVSVQGATASAELAGWIQSLVQGLGAHDVRIIIAGRDPPGALGCGDLIDRLADIAVQRPPIELHDLDTSEATELLVNCGVSDRDVASAAAKAVPGNPLLLRITADALQSENLAAEVRDSHAKDRVDSASANAYLTRRIVAHLADPAGRPYLLTAMHLPVVYRAVLRDVLIPLVDHKPDETPDRRMLDRVFLALRGARWLARPATDGRSLCFQRDIRTLVLKLLDTDPEQRDLAQEIHQRAVEFHSRRKGVRERACAIYHRAMLGEPPVRPPNAAAIVAQLGDMLGDLSPEWRDALLAPPAPPSRSVSDTVAVAPRRPPRSTAGTGLPRKDTPSDDDWRLYLEGVGAKSGEGDRLLDRDRAEEALQLYRDRPTQPPGVPPTFVIRALADMAEWDSGDLDIEAVWAETGTWQDASRLTPAMLSRLYWITRLTLQRDDGRLSAKHNEILLRCCSKLTGEGLTTMPAIVSVAEAASRTKILPDRVVSGRGAIQSVTRVRLARAVIDRQPFGVSLTIEAIAVAQLDWRRRLNRSAGGTIDVSRLAWVEKELLAMAGQPIAEFNARLRNWERTVDLKWDGKDIAPVILLLRGQTTEFLRPLRQILVDLDSPDPGQSLIDLFKPVIAQMSLLPAEFSTDRLADLLRQDRKTWCAAFVGFADRARLLPLLCRGLAALPGGSLATAKAQRVARSFLAWDKALCAGGSSAWQASD